MSDARPRWVLINGNYFQNQRVTHDEIMYIATQYLVAGFTSKELADLFNIKNRACVNTKLKKMYTHGYLRRTGIKLINHHPDNIERGYIYYV